MSRPDAPWQPTTERGRVDQRHEVAVIGDPPVHVTADGDRAMVTLMYGSLVLRGTRDDLMRFTATLWQLLKDAPR